MLIVIVCYRATQLTIDCMKSIAEQVRDVQGIRVAICENGTGDQAVRELTDTIVQNRWAAWTNVIAVSPNRGFAGGNNAILSQVLRSGAVPEFILLLNSDTILRPDALKHLLSAAEKWPEAGIIGPRLEWPDGVPQESCFLDFTPIHEFIAAAGTGPLTRLFRRRHGILPITKSPQEAEWISFACALIRGSVLKQCGLLDVGYYLYFDDADYCRTVRAHGWKIMYEPVARVAHLRGQSNPLKALSEQRRRRPRYWYESRSRYYAKYYGVAALWIANVGWWLGRTISFCREWVGRRQSVACESEWRDIWTNAWRPLTPLPRLSQEDDIAKAQRQVTDRACVTRS